MSHQKLNSIKIDKYNNRVVFMEKSNNDTSPFRHGDATIPLFIHLCWGNVYQHSNKLINSIINEMQKEFSKLVSNVDDLWWTFDKCIQNDTMQEIREDLRVIFYKYCDKISNINHLKH